MKYEISLVIEEDDDYCNGEQLEDLRNDIEMTVAEYNCFCMIGDVKVTEVQDGRK